jgi:hypothetical protein
MYGLKMRSLILAVLVMLTSPNAAQAGWRIDRSVAIAQAVWKPSCGTLSLRYGVPEDAGAAAGASGWAWNGDCKIGVNAGNHYEFEELCTIVVHEGGHVAGLGHSPNRRSVMYAEPLVLKTTARINGREITRWDGVDRRCLQRGRPFLERAGLL